MATKDFKRKLSAILSADVAGYSRLMGEDEAATVSTIETYREVMSTLIKQHRGRVVDSPGDNVLAEFGSVVDAVQCGVVVQNELQARNAELPENRRMQFRIGINLGDVIEEGDRIYGDGVNIAARLEALANPGGICISKTAFDHIETKLPLGYEYLGDQTVKNIAKPVGAYRVLMEPRITVAGEKEKAKLVPFWRKKAILAGGAALVVVIIVAIMWNFYFRPPFEPASVEKMAFSLPDKPSIAVLPFVNMSDNPEQDFFSDGLTEEIITALSKTPQLFVIASNTSFTYKGKPVKVKNVSEELGVRYVIEGSVRRAGERVRITAQMIDALKDRHLWAERYDKEFKDIFSIQDDITKKIITAVHVKLTEGERARVFAKGTSNLQAYLKAVQADWFVNQATKDSVLRAQQLAEEAIALDSNYAYAHMALGTVHIYFVWLGISQSPRDSLKSAIHCWQKAVALNPESGEAHALLANGLVMARQYDKAVAECERAMVLEPNSYRTLYPCASALTFVGRREEAIPLFREALRINPKPPNSLYRHYGVALRDSGRYDEAIEVSKKAVEQGPDDMIAYVVLGSSYGMAGREEEARAAAKEILRINPKFSVARLEKISPHKDRAVAKRFCDALRKAGLPE
jgi:adenylate cyclase